LQNSGNPNIYYEYNVESIIFDHLNFTTFSLTHSDGNGNGYDIDIYNNNGNTHIKYDVYTSGDYPDASFSRSAHFDELDNNDYEADGSSTTSKNSTYNVYSSYTTLSHDSLSENGLTAAIDRTTTYLLSGTYTYNGSGGYDPSLDDPTSYFSSSEAH